MTPCFKGGLGKLHVDVVDGTVYFEGWSGEDNTWCEDKKQVDLQKELSELF